MASASEAQRDGDLLQHISRYCEDAMDAAKQAGSEALFMDSRSQEQFRCLLRYNT